MNHDPARIEEYKHDLDLYGFVVVEDLITAGEAGRLAGLLQSLVARHARSDGADLALRGVLNYTDPPTASVRPAAGPSGLSRVGPPRPG